MTKQYFQSAGVNSYLNPLMEDGQLIHAVNVESFPYGAKRKRPGYDSYLGNLGTTVTSMWQFAPSGTQFWNYAAAGSKIYYSIQGTGDWTVAGNGTISSGAHVGHAIQGTTMILGDGVGSTRHTTNGTSFTNTSLAPVSPAFEEYQGRVYAINASNAFYSVANDITNWNTSGTSDSSSFEVTGAGTLTTVFKGFDKLWFVKSSGVMKKWDGFSLIDLATTYGPSSPYSIGTAEGYPFFVNQYGHYGFTGGQPKLLSNAIQRQFYNPANTGIAGTAFSTIPGACHRYDYLASVGTVTDDFTDRTISDCIIKYDFQKNEYLNWSFADKPTAFLSAKDSSNDIQLYFGDASGNTYKLNPTSTSDNGDPITSELVFVFHFGSPEFEKKWNYFRGVFNPGCQAKVQYACSNVYTYENLRWFDIDDVTNGVVEDRFEGGSQSRFLFIRLYEYSKDPQWTHYGWSIGATVQPK